MTSKKWAARTVLSRNLVRMEVCTSLLCAPARKKNESKNTLKKSTCALDCLPSHHCTALHRPTSQHVELLLLLTLWSSVQLQAPSTTCGSCVYFYFSITLFLNILLPEYCVGTRSVLDREVGTIHQLILI